MVLDHSYHHSYQKFLKLPPELRHNQFSGGQILHFNTTNRPILEGSDTESFIRTHMEHAKVFHHDADILKYATEQAAIYHPNGLWLELGVGAGKTTNFIAALNPSMLIHGFDSFEGLPLAWRTLPKGTFALSNPEIMPPLLPNIQIHQGLFVHTLPAFIKKLSNQEFIAFMHIDSDLYESASLALNLLHPFIVKNTIISFDEYFNYEDWQNHEHKALSEYIKKYNRKISYIAYNDNHEQVTIRIEN